MSARAFHVGERLGPLRRGPITTRQLVEYAGSSLDFNRIHYDEPFAKAGGFPQVIAHGMLSMAFLGQLVAGLTRGPAAIRQLSARFRAVTFPGDEVEVRGEVTAVREEDGRTLVELSLQAMRSDGTLTLDGAATLSL